MYNLVESCGVGTFDSLLDYGVDYKSDTVLQKENNNRLFPGQ